MSGRAFALPSSVGALLFASAACPQMITGGMGGGSGASVTFANPSATVGASATYGSAGTVMRSDAAPALGVGAAAANLGFVPAQAGVNSDITGLSGLTTPLPPSEGGTGQASPTGLIYYNGGSSPTPLTAGGSLLDNVAGLSGVGFLTRTGAGVYAFQSLTGGISATNLASGAAVSNLGFTPAHSGSNSDITAISGLTAPLAPSEGGTGQANPTGIPYFNGASPPTFSTSLPAPAWFPGYVSGNWYAPPYVYANAGQTQAMGRIQLSPFAILSPVTISSLGSRVTTSSSGGNIQLAIYADNPTTGRPVGAALCTTGNLSTTTPTTVSGACSGGIVTLGAGLYWGAIQSDNGTAVVQTAVNAQAVTSAFIGSATLSNVSATASSLNLYLYDACGGTCTFGFWPTLTGAVLVEDTSAMRGPLIEWKVN